MFLWMLYNNDHGCTKHSAADAAVENGAVAGAVAEGATDGSAAKDLQS